MPSFARKDITTPDLVSTYHCIARCVRRAFLCGIDKYSNTDYEHRKLWIKDRIRKLSEIFAIEIGAYAVMSNHLHLNLRIRPDFVKAWSDEDVVMRWWNLFPRQIKGEYVDSPPKEILDKWLNDSDWLCERRRRLSSISWFMRCLCEYIARKANREDCVTGRFWEGRFVSQALLDEPAILAANIYIDLNPVRASRAPNLESSDYTSIQDRIQAQKNTYHEEKKIFLAPISAAFETTPFLLLDEKDYIDVVRWYEGMTKEDKTSIMGSPPSILEKVGIRKNTDISVLNKLFSSASWVIGSAGKMKEKARQTQRKWINATKLAGSIIC